jgi:DNA (cytosine-5)-methyltransferase 1
MRFLSVCSGIEAASAAWKPLGWTPVAFSEIEPFPCAVLAHHYPTVPNLGDMTKFKDWPDYAIDLLCGGTPCQSFSVAGLRKGLDDPRGNLMLTFGAIAAKYRPKWLVWENVPGVLSSNGGRDFGAFLGLLGVLGYGFAYRVLDAQYYGVAQRRRRVFVVGCLGDWRSAAAVLFERHSLSGHPAPSRKARQVAPTIPSRSTAGGGLGTDFDCDGGLIPQVSPTLLAEGNKTGGARPPGTTVDTCGSLIPVLAQCLTTGAGRRYDSETETETILPVLHCRDLAQTITSNYGKQVDNSDTALGPNIVAFSSKDFGADASLDLAPTLRAMGHNTSHANGGGQMAVAYAIQAGATRTNPASGPDGVGVQADHAYTLEARAEVQCVAVSLRGREGGSTAELGDEVGGCLRASSGGGDKPHVLLATQVRRLTPTECERLQGFSDNFTQIPWRKKAAADCPDGPRYKALGNSWAVPVAAWIGSRIDAVEAIHATQQKEAA